MEGTRKNRYTKLSSMSLTNTPSGEHRPCQRSAISWPWRVSRKVRAGQEAGPGSKQHAPVREPGVESEWQKDLLQQEAQKGKSKRNTAVKKEEIPLQREVGKTVLFLGMGKGKLLFFSIVFRRVREIKLCLQ